MTSFHCVLIAYLLFIGLVDASYKEKLFQYCLYEQKLMPSGILSPTKYSTTVSDLSKTGEQKDLHLEEHEEPKYGKVVAKYLRKVSPKIFSTPIIKIILSYLRTIMKPQSWVAQGHMHAVRFGVIFGYQSLNLRLLTVGEDAYHRGLISMWSLPRKVLLLRQFIDPGYVTCCSVAPNDQFMVTTCNTDSFLRVWDLTSVRDVHRIPPVRRASLCVYDWCKILGDNQTVITADGYQRLFHIWVIKNDNPITSQCLQECRGERFGGHHSTMFTSARDHTLIYLDQHRWIKTLHLQSGAYQCTRPSHAMYSCSVSADGQTIVSGSSGGEIEVWNAGISAREKFWEPYCVDCAVSTDGEIIAGMITTSSRMCIVKCWKRIKETNTLELGSIRRLRGIGQSLRISPDDTFIAVAVQNTIYLWDFASSRFMMSLKHSFWIDWFYITQDSRYIIATTKNTNNRVRVYVEEIRNCTPKKLRYNKKEM